MRDPWVRNTEFQLPARCNTLIINFNNIIYTNEYPDNEEEIADGLNQLFREAYYLSSILNKLTEYIISRKLLE